MSQAKARITAQEFQKFAPQANAAFTALSQAVAASGLEKDLLELIKLRASQINGCAYCTQYHLNEARHMGVTAAKVDLVVVWREAGIFSEREKAALAWAELVTGLSAHHISDEDYAAVSAQFPPQELAWLTTAVALINTLNRVAATFQYAPPIPRHEIHAAQAPVRETTQA